jgi:hypothetical protein
MNGTSSQEGGSYYYAESSTQHTHQSPIQQQHVNLQRMPLGRSAGGRVPSARTTVHHQQLQRRGSDQQNNNTSNHTNFGRRKAPASDPGRSTQTNNPHVLATLLRTSRATDEELNRMQNLRAGGLEAVQALETVHKQHRQQQELERQNSQKFLTKKSGDPDDRVKRRQTLAKLYAGVSGGGGSNTPTPNNQHPQQNTIEQVVAERQQQFEQRPIQDFAGVFSNLSTDNNSNSSISIHQQQLPLNLPNVPHPNDTLRQQQLYQQMMFQDQYLQHHQRNNNNNLPYYGARSPSPTLPQQQNNNNAILAGRRALNQNTNTNNQPVGGFINSNVFSLLKRTNNNNNGGSSQQQLFQESSPIFNRAQDQQEAKIYLNTTNKLPLGAMRQQHNNLVPDTKSRVSRSPVATMMMNNSNDPQQQQRSGSRQRQTRNKWAFDAGAPIFVPPNSDILLGKKSKEQEELEWRQQHISAERSRDLDSRLQQEERNRHLRFLLAEQQQREQQQQVFHSSSPQNHYRFGNSRVGLYHQQQGDIIPPPLNPEALQQEIVLSPTSTLNQTTATIGNNNIIRTGLNSASSRLSSANNTTSGFRGSAVVGGGRSPRPLVPPNGGRDASLSPMSNSSFGLTHNNMVNDLLKWAQDLDAGSQNLL